MSISKHILPTIVIAHFFCTSLWFAGNGVLPDLMQAFDLEAQALGHLTAAVQVGFIVGTLLFALLSMADRYAPSKVFGTCALLGAAFNLAVVWEGNGASSLLLWRFGTGFFLAGIYPVGMKIASDYYQKGLGKSLGYLVGALVVGTAFPHLLREVMGALSWKIVLVATSGLAVLGGLLMVLFVADGPYRKPSPPLQLTALFRVFRQPTFRAAAFGYFGHMWELYAFWAFVPVLLQRYSLAHPAVAFNIPLWSFLIIGIGGLACVLGGYLAERFSARRVATGALALSGGCCLMVPGVLSGAPAPLFLGFLLIWGMVVVADSPLFSTLVAQHAPTELRGTALTIVNCLGFATTIVSIQVLNAWSAASASNGVFALLAMGPAAGLIALLRRPNVSS